MPMRSDLAALRLLTGGTPGVGGAVTTSIAIGGTSVMRASYAGTPTDLVLALRARGWQATASGGVLKIKR